MTIGTHSVVFIPDPDVQSWGPVLNSNPYMTTDIAGWGAMPTTDAWHWEAPGVAAVAPGGNGWYTRDPTGTAILRGASTLFRLRVRFTVKVPVTAYLGLFYGNTMQNAAHAPFAGANNSFRTEQTFNCPKAGTYTMEMTHNPGEVPAGFTFISPSLHWFSLYANADPSIDSVELWGQGADLVDISCLVDTVTIHHGRDSTTGQPEAPSATVDMSLDTGEEEFPAALDVGGIIRVTTTTPLTQSTRFVGRVTDIIQGWEAAGEETPDRVAIQVIATGALADLGRRVVGDVPWTQELDGSRISRIMTAAGYTLDPTTSDPGTVQILARDVDSQPALDVAHGTAESAGGIVWATRDGDIRYADADHRRGAVSSLEIDSCDILVTPQWSRTTNGLINDVSIGYGVAAGGGDQPRYTADRPDSKAAYGEYGFSATTELAALADASAMGQLLLTRNRVPVWVMSALPVDVAGLSDADTATLLGMEMHDLLSLTGLPGAGNAPTSALLWLEGWSETLEYGVHELELIVSGYCRTSPAPRWDDTPPDKTWDSLGTLTWDDTACLGPTPNLGRWNDVPASNRWNQNPPSLTWNTWPTPA